jgi:hypothetical protein
MTATNTKIFYVEEVLDNIVELTKSIYALFYLFLDPVRKPVRGLDQIQKTNYTSFLNMVITNIGKIYRVGSNSSFTSLGNMLYILNSSSRNQDSTSSSKRHSNIKTIDQIVNEDEKKTVESLLLDPKVEELKEFWESGCIDYDYSSGNKRRSSSKNPDFLMDIALSVNNRIFSIVTLLEQIILECSYCAGYRIKIEESSSAQEGPSENDLTCIEFSKICLVLFFESFSSDKFSVKDKVCESLSSLVGPQIANKTCTEKFFKTIEYKPKIKPPSKNTAKKAERIVINLVDDEDEDERESENDKEEKEDSKKERASNLEKKPKTTNSSEKTKSTKTNKVKKDDDDEKEDESINENRLGESSEPNDQKTFSHVTRIRDTEVDIIVTVKTFLEDSIFKKLHSSKPSIKDVKNKSVSVASSCYIGLGESFSRFPDQGVVVLPSPISISKLFYRWVSKHKPLALKNKSEKNSKSPKKTSTKLVLEEINYGKMAREKIAKKRTVLNEKIISAFDPKFESDMDVSNESLNAMAHLFGCPCMGLGSWDDTSEGNEFMFSKVITKQEIKEGSSLLTIYDGHHLRHCHCLRELQIFATVDFFYFLQRFPEGSLESRIHAEYLQKNYDVDPSNLVYPSSEEFTERRDYWACPLKGMGCSHALFTDKKKLLRHIGFLRKKEKEDFEEEDSEEEKNPRNNKKKPSSNMKCVNLDRSSDTFPPKKSVSNSEKNEAVSALSKLKDYAFVFLSRLSGRCYKVGWHYLKNKYMDKLMKSWIDGNVILAHVAVWAKEHGDDRAAYYFNLMLKREKKRRGLEVPDDDDSDDESYKDDQEEEEYEEMEYHENVKTNKNNVPHDEEKKDNEREGEEGDEEEEEKEVLSKKEVENEDLNLEKQSANNDGGNSVADKSKQTVIVKDYIAAKKSPRNIYILPPPPRPPLNEDDDCDEEETDNENSSDSSNSNTSG